MITTKNAFFFLLWLSIGVAGLTCAALSGMYLYLSPKLPEVETLRDTKYQIPLRVYTRDNQLIGEFGEKLRSPIAFNDIPADFVNAVLAAEDDRFYQHKGVDLKGLLRAVADFAQKGGGSTITMQVARNFFLHKRREFSRKFNEILLSLQIERELSKEEIFSLYVNKIFLGKRAYGIQAAANVYYGKNVDELSLAQMAMISGIPKAPSTFNPVVNPKRALIRRNWILRRMRDLGFIPQTRYQAAIQEPVTARIHGTQLEAHAPYVAEMARSAMIKKFGRGAYTDGYRVYVTVDSTLQAAARAAIVKGLEAYDIRHGYRGTEGQLPIAGRFQQPWPLAVPETADQSTSPESAPIDEAQTSQFKEVLAEWADFDEGVWHEELSKKTTLGGWRAAGVSGISDAGIALKLASGEQILLPVAQGLKKIRGYISEDRRTKIFKSPSEFLSLGSIVRVRKDKKGLWQFGQIPKAQGAFVALDPIDGSILSVIGGYDFAQSNFNRATQAARQPGSNFKPFVYSAALENGMTPATIINDAPIVIKDASLEGTWRPENSSAKFNGETRLREALYRSLNLVSIRVLRNTGIEKVISGMSRYGFDQKKMPRDLSLALGSHGLTPLDVATGYAVFANGGFRVKPYLIDRVITVTGETAYQKRPDTVCNDRCEEQRRLDELARQWKAESLTFEEDILSESDEGIGGSLTQTTASVEVNSHASPVEASEAGSEALLGLRANYLPKAKRVQDKSTNFLINSIMRDVIKRGTGRKAKVLKRTDLAGKTGTTNGPTDAWFSGFHPSLVATAWVGFDQNYKLGSNEYGGSAALPIWIDFMRVALDGVAEQPLTPPDDIVSVRINKHTGERSSADDPNAIFEWFRQDSVPKAVARDKEPSSDSLEELF